MKILHLSTTDIKGGAGIAAYRLHKGLLDSGVSSLMYVQRKSSDDKSIFSAANKFNLFLAYFCAAGDKIFSNIFGPKNYEITSFSVFSSFDIGVINKFNPDIVHLHWICGGFMSPKDISKIKKPIVWTMHDTWPFSGVRHYNLENTFYKTANSSDTNFFEKLFWLRKKYFFSKLESLLAVSPSRWLAKEAASSKLFRDVPIVVAGNGIDTNIFKPKDKTLSRKNIGLPVDKKILLFGAVDSLSGERKGYKLLLDIIKNIAPHNPKDCVLAVFGSSEKSSINFDLPVYFLGNIKSEEALAEAYSAADIFIAPSIEDNLPNTVLESMSCGTPVAAFSIGGMPDMIDNDVNGILSEPFNTRKLSSHILKILLSNEDLNKMSIEARKKIVEHFDIKIAVKKYSDLYNSILNK